MDIELLKGVGKVTLNYLDKLNIYNIQDLIEYYPFRYNILKIVSINDANETISCTIKGIIDTEPRISYIKKLNKLSFRVLCDNTLVNVIIFNRAFLKNNLKIGRIINITGKYDRLKNQFLASDISFDKINGTKIYPIYHLVNGLKNKVLSNIINEAFNTRFDIEDYIPNYLVDKYKFLNKKDSCYEIHNPSNITNLKQAKIRTIYEEFFIFMFKMNYLKHKYTINNKGLSRKVDYSKVEEYINSLPFTLTIDQLNTVNDIYKDLTNPNRMNRLVLGDVGSGKTCVATIAMYINYLSGYQSSLMAPTEILARQHYESISNSFNKLGIRVGLLVGSMKKKEKDTVLNELSLGNIDVLIGTHALISDNVLFKNLGLVITDEQHRFGVNQRSNLQNKGIMSDVLYLSATPIPRTYALTLYGDMDTSLIKTKPSGRKEIITKVYKNKEIKEVLSKMLEEIKANHQIYVVAPLIEDEDGNTELNDVVKLKEKISIAFNNKISVEILHGKMKNTEKDQVMNDFKEGKIKILISTTVIEVGVDVKNSTMMVIFNAERFGLATLHQLRGRVGRNDLQSYCYLISDYDAERLKVMEESNDGFYISEKDFELRGEGDLFGTRQSGDMTFKMADIKRDYKILLQCKNDAKQFIENNYSSNFQEYPQFKEIIKQIEFLD